MHEEEKHFVDQHIVYSCFSLVLTLSIHLSELLLNLPFKLRFHFEGDFFIAVILGIIDGQPLNSSDIFR